MDLLFFLQKQAIKNSVKIRKILKIPQKLKMAERQLAQI